MRTRGCRLVRNGYGFVVARFDELEARIGSERECDRHDRRICWRNCCRWRGRRNDGRFRRRKELALGLSRWTLVATAIVRHRHGCSGRFLTVLRRRVVGRCDVVCGGAYDRSRDGRRRRYG